MSADRTVPLAALQRESSHVNALNGTRAFCVGVLHEVLRAPTLEAAKTSAEMALADLAAHDETDPNVARLGDPADWSPR